jgi:hypothetical protein
MNITAIIKQAGIMQQLNDLFTKDGAETLIGVHIQLSSK